jgi:hypothetical protein
LLAAIPWGTTGTARAFAPAGATPPAVGAIRLIVGGSALLAASGVAGVGLPAVGLPVLSVGRVEGSATLR